MLAAPFVAVVASAEPAKPVTARIVKLEVVSSDVALTVAAGTNSGVEKTWTGCVIDTGTKCLADGKLVIIRVDKTTLIAKTSLTPAQITAHPTVLLTAP